MVRDIKGSFRRATAPAATGAVDVACQDRAMTTLSVCGDQSYNPSIAPVNAHPFEKARSSTATVSTPDLVADGVPSTPDNDEAFARPAPRGLSAVAIAWTVCVAPVRP